MLTYELLKERVGELRAIGNRHMKKLYNRAIYEPEFDAAWIEPIGGNEYLANVTISVIEKRIKRYTFQIKYGVLSSGAVFVETDPYHIATPYSGILKEWLEGLLFELGVSVRAKKFSEAIKEELVAKAWAPERVAKWLEAGVALEAL